MHPTRGTLRSESYRPGPPLLPDSLTPRNSEWSDSHYDDSGYFSLKRPSLDSDNGEEDLFSNRAKSLSPTVADHTTEEELDKGFQHAGLVFGDWLSDINFPYIQAKRTVPNFPRDLWEELAEFLGDNHPILRAISFEYDTVDAVLTMTGASDLHQDAVHGMQTEIDVAAQPALVLGSHQNVANGGRTLLVNTEDGKIRFKIPDMTTSLRINPPQDGSGSDSETLEDLESTNVDAIEFEASVSQTRDNVFAKVIVDGCTTQGPDGRVYKHLTWIVINIDESARTASAIPSFNTMDHNISDYRSIPRRTDEPHILIGGIAHGLDILLGKISAEVYVFRGAHDLDLLAEGVRNHWGPQAYFDAGLGVRVLPHYSGHDGIILRNFLAKWDEAMVALRRLAITTGTYAARRFYNMSLAEWKQKCPHLESLPPVRNPMPGIIESLRQGSWLTADTRRKNQLRDDQPRSIEFHNADPDKAWKWAEEDIAAKKRRKSNSGGGSAGPSVRDNAKKRRLDMLRCSQRPEVPAQPGKASSSEDIKDSFEEKSEAADLDFEEPATQAPSLATAKALGKRPQKPIPKGRTRAKGTQG
ncbi:uncharacterized protein B0H18DRAFT_1122830 [Fomitopsis serialis]|uniref:uncharacterized protein n=1 Tax=Fomitopsis serialis TaxID=139415 RepID=UPI0020076DC2|nr:uncharacterized protein B0H18DRAFT_1122830 [Neoantrodia serialis]KAH9918862.1 hypothetical protein B0H18DRAFT_1122830 [Neoantrodia serialis]